MSKNPGLGARSEAIKAASIASHKSASKVEPETEGGLVRASLRLPKQLHEQLRTIAFNERIPIHDLLLEGVALAISKHTK